MRHYKTLTWTDRLKIEAWQKAKIKPQKMAEMLGVHFSTVYRELKRGQYEHLNTDYTTEMRYSPDKAEDKKQNFLRAKGPDLKIGNDMAFAEFVEYWISKEKYSPEAALGKIKQLNLNFKTSVCKQTLYRYIEQGVFLTLTNNSLPVKKNKKKKKAKAEKAAKPPKGISIEKRPAMIAERSSFGHWEMDCVEGCKRTKGLLLVLTERLTRYEIVRKIKDKSAKSVVSALNALEREYGSRLFSIVFKTITVDNGCEFSDYLGIETSLNGKNKRTVTYYCHPYSSWERGSNENQNKMVRRHYPKGCDFSKVTQKQVTKLQNWINDYPRKLFNYSSSSDLFEAYLNEIKTVS
ncbi:MAG: IS30 family transposase [Clostridia bacterium]|nr:IS30 family transposase [Clostridia bacterium]